MKRRRRTPIVVLAIVVVVFVIAGVVLDGVARALTQNQIQTEVRTALSLPASTPVDVSVGGTSVLLQLAQGSLDQVHVSVPQLAIGELSGAAELSARGLPLDIAKPIGSASITFTTDQAGVQKLLASFSGLPVTSAAVADGAIKLSGNVDLLGLKIPIAIVEVPSAANGQLVLTPTSFEVNGAKFTRASLTKTFGSLGQSLTRPQRLCVAGSLPKSFVLDRVSVIKSSVRLVVSARSVGLNDQLFTTKGVCP